MKIDAHQHFWKYNPATYGWISDVMPELKRDYLPQDLKPLLADNAYDGSIAVQARQDLDETFWLLDLAKRNEFIKGVVGWVDLCSPQLPALLEKFANHPKLRGVRHILQDEPDDRHMLRPDFRRGIAQLHQHGLTYDLLLHPRHLPIAVQLVQEFPQQRFVLDHIAKPLIADNVLEPWDRDTAPWQGSRTSGAKYQGWSRRHAGNNGSLKTFVRTWMLFSRPSAPNV